MKVSMQFPLLTKSENILRSLPFVVANAPPGKARGIAHSIANGVKKQRATVRMILDSQLPRLRGLVQRGASTTTLGELSPNFYRVTLIRISAGELDTDGLAGALKAVRDEVAAWLGIDDGPRAPASWRVGQQRGPRGVHAVRIEIEDDDPDQRQVHRIVGPPIAKLGPVVGDVRHAPRGETHEHPGVRVNAQAPPIASRVLSRPGEATEVDRMLAEALPVLRKHVERASVSVLAGIKRGAAQLARYRSDQAPLVFRRSYYAPPGQDEEADEMTLEELTGPLFERDEPPPRIIKGGRELRRRQDFHPALGEHWIYEAAPSAARPTPREERAEARR